jgi:hypothetical protein
MSEHTVDYIAIAISIGALIVSGYSAIQYRKANSIAKKHWTRLIVPLTYNSPL